MYAPQIGLDKAENSANPGWNEDIVVDYLNRHYTEKTRCIFGHMAFFGIHELHPFSQREVRYIVFLREPLARIVSLYNFLRFNSKNVWHHEIVENDWALTEWFANSRGLWLHDGQIRQLLLWQRKDVLTRRQLHAEDLAAAQQALAQMWFIGCQEQFHADAGQLYRLLGFKKIVANEAVNVTQGHIRPDAETAGVIARDNALDAELYRYALSLRARRLQASAGAESGEGALALRRRVARWLPFRSSTT